MAYTNTWDDTAPLDTSLASLLGQDIRTFKVDIRERLSQTSGPLANRPTPEAGFAGITYLASDTYQMFQWSGSAWVDITQALRGSTILFKNPPAGFTGNGATQIVASHSLPGGFLSDHGGIRIYARAFNDDGSLQTNPRTMIFEVNFGNAVFGLSSGTVSSAKESGIDVQIFNNFNVAQQFTFLNLLGTSNDLGWEGTNERANGTTITVDTSQNVQITCTVQIDNGTRYTLSGFYVQLLEL